MPTLEQILNAREAVKTADAAATAAADRGAYDLPGGGDCPEAIAAAVAREALAEIERGASPQLVLIADLYDVRDLVAIASRRAARIAESTQNPTQEALDALAESCHGARWKINDAIGTALTLTATPNA
jgi:hypothetical protein